MGRLARWFEQGRHREPEPEPELVHDAEWLAKQPDPYGKLMEYMERPENRDTFHVGADSRQLVQTYSETAFMILGASRSTAGKTNSVIIPNVLRARGACVCVSVKGDIFDATALVCSEKGNVWHANPDGAPVKPGALHARSSPMTGAKVWDTAIRTFTGLIKASASAAGAEGKDRNPHFEALAARGMAAIAHGVALAGGDMRVMHGMVNRQNIAADLVPLLQVIRERGGAPQAADALEGLLRTPERERGSVFTSMAVALRAYDSDAGMASADNPNFDPDAFVASSDTHYITAADPALCGPLIVALLVQIRLAAKRRVELDKEQGISGRPALAMVIDEAANTAAIDDLPAQATTGGVGVNTCISLQSSAQARARWGRDVGGAFPDIFPNIMAMPGGRDDPTLDLLSKLGGEYLREVYGYSEGYDPKGRPVQNRSMSHTVQKRLPPDVIYNGHSQNPDLCLYFPHGGGYTWIYATPYYRATPWPQIIVKAMHKLATCKDAGARVLLPIPDLDRDGTGQWLSEIGAYEAYYEYKAELEAQAEEYRAIQNIKALGGDSATVSVWCAVPGSADKAIANVLDPFVDSWAMRKAVSRRGPLQFDDDAKVRACINLYMGDELVMQLTPYSDALKHRPPPGEVFDLLDGAIPDVAFVAYAYDSRGSELTRQFVTGMAERYVTIADFGSGPELVR